jgi:AraC-like DNA-binding protein
MPLFIRSASLVNYVEIAHGLGLDPLPLLQKEGLSYYALLDPDTLIPTSTVTRLLESSAALARVEDFGLRLAETRQLSNLGPLAIALHGEPTLRSAFEALTRYMRLHNEALSTCMDEVEGLVIVRQVFHTEPQQPARQANELMVGVLHRTLQRFLGPQWQPRSVCFTHAAPANSATYQRMFGSAFRFNQEFNGIVCRGEDMELPLPQYDPIVAQQSHQYLDSLLAQSQAGMSDKVRNLVLNLLPLGVCSAERIAQHLGVDRRTMHYHLSVQGSSYSQVLNGVRCVLSERYCASRGRPLSEVAELLGFASLSAFSRWYRLQFGASVSQLRAPREGGATGF